MNIPIALRRHAHGFILGALAVAAVAALGPAAAARAATVDPNCAVRSHVTAIIDDSGSTERTDPYYARADVLDLFIERQLLAGRPERSLAAVEFGEEANAIFGSTPITEASAPIMEAGIRSALQADGGDTNYEAAFAEGNAVNPSADARVFFTDGEHNVGDYEDGHLPGPKTHVLGLNVTSSYGDALLRRIASETGGFFQPLDDPGEAIAAATKLDAELSCLPEPKQRTIDAPLAGETAVLVRAPVPRAAQALSVVQSIATSTGADIEDLTLILRERNGHVIHKVRSRGATATTAGGDTCRVKTKRKRQGHHKKRFKPRLKVSCAGHSSFLATELEGRHGRGLRRALGGKLAVRVQTSNDAYLPYGTQVTGQVTQDG